MLFLALPVPQPVFVNLRFHLSIVHKRVRARAHLRGEKKRSNRQQRRQRYSASALLKCGTAKRQAAERRDTLSRSSLLVSSSHVVLSPYVYTYVSTYVRAPAIHPASLFPPLSHPAPRCTRWAVRGGNADAEVGRTLLSLSRQGGRKYSNYDRHRTMSRSVLGVETEARVPSCRWFQDRGRT